MKRPPVSKQNFGISALSHIQNFTKLIIQNECLNQPCENGGTCIDLIAKFQCLCPAHFNGKKCENRIDECALYSLSDIGCKNNGTCTNNGALPGIKCHCPTGFYGTHCQLRSSSCDLNLDLCGEHGHCLPIPGEDSSGVSYKCLCEFGYVSDNDPENPTCVDIDECAMSPCYPGAGCVNTPGGFRCTSCPAGMQGNGIQCTDFDECASEFTNDCSKSPKVECLNNFGGYTCGPCPRGYKGDGKKCEIASSGCDESLCNENANCTDAGAFVVTCVCKEGYTGDGIGMYGCNKLNATYAGEYCNPAFCNERGECEETNSFDYGTVRTCRCNAGFIGDHCEHSDVCVGKTCSYRGTCKTGLDRDPESLIIRLPVCDCDEGFYGDNCELEETGCGFHTHNDTGAIEFNGRDLVKRVACQWTIQLLDSRKIIQFKFENYTTTSFLHRFSKGCNTAFGNISVYDGLSTDRPLIGTFCQDVQTVGVPFYTSGSAAKLLFDSNEALINSYFRISWNASSPRCGGRFTGSTGTISYSDIHDEDVCVWYISVPPQYHLELSVTSLTMGTGAVVNCSINSLEVFDHQSASEPLRIMELCETITKPRIIRTTVPYATIYFKTDRRIVDPNLSTVSCDSEEPNSWCGVGFTIKYRVIELEAGCGGEFRPDSKGQMSGYITSPHYPHSYFPNLNCLWRLDAAIENSTDLSIAESARKVRIEFIDFDVQTNVQKLDFMGRSQSLESCMGDHVRLLPKGGIFCNVRPPSGIYSNHHFELGFRSDEFGTGRGFKLKYESICEMDFTEKNGTIQSPNYPAPSKDPFKCTYRIIATKKEAIRVTFRDIGLRASISTCFYNKKAQAASQDYIEFSGGHASSEQINKRYVCARYPFVAPIGQIVTSANVPLSITYSTSGNDENYGFSFDYEIYDVGCGAFFFTSTGTLTSPGYPERYPSHMYCIYEVVSGSGNQVRLDFDVFDVENVAHNEGCGFDNVRVFDSFYTDDDNHGELLGQFCGMSIPPPLISSSNKMAVVFMSDRSVNGVGFSAKYRVVKADTDCDRTFAAESGVIEYNGTQYPRNTKCDYIIALPRMHRISLSFENISMACHAGAITVKNGMSATSPDFPGFDKLCDRPNPVKIITQGNRAFIRVTTTSPTTTFFRLRYEIFSAGCGGRVFGVSGYFSAPQYPDKDSRSLDCSWTVSVAEGNRVKLTFPFIDDLASGTQRGECTTFSANYLEVIDDSENKNNLLRRYCVKETSTAAVLADSNRLNVRYVQHGGSYQGSLFGFLGHFTTDCEDITHTAPHGTIQTPNYGTSDTNPVNCKYTIRTSPGSRIRLIFHRFNVGYSCSFTYLRIPKSQVANVTYTLDQPSPYLDYEAPNVHSFCHNSVPAEIVSTNNVLELSFKGTPEDYFWLSYSTIGCGELIYTNNTLVAVAQSDFTANSTVRECAWTVKAPVGYVIRFKIDYAYFMDNPEAGSKCDDIVNPKSEENDGIAFYSGTSNASGVPQKILCHTLTNESYLSHTNELHMRMRLSMKNIQHSARGYVLRGGIYFEKYNMSDDARCGGVVEVSPTNRVTITSPGYPKPYDNGIKCIWEFRTPEGSMLQFNLKEFTNPSGDKRQVYALMYPANDAITNCSVSMSYLEGGLSFYRGSYNQSANYFYNKNMIFRVCNGLSQPYAIDPTTDKAVVIFQGSNQPRVTESGDDKKSHGGFVLEAWATCGGKLVAEQKPKTFMIEHDGENGSINECEYAFARNADNEDEGDTLYIRGEHLHSSNAINSLANSFMISCGTEVEETAFSDSHIINEARDWGTCNDKLLLRTKLMPGSGRYLITYGLENTFCGGTFKGGAHVVKYDVDPNHEADCEWVFVSPGGAFTSVTAEFPLLPESEFCQENYIEVKLSNETKPRPRVCGAAEVATFESVNVTVRLRYRPDKDNMPEEPQWKLTLASHLLATNTPPVGFLESSGAAQTIQWELVAPENTTFVKVAFDEYNIPPNSGIKLELRGECPNMDACFNNIEGFWSTDSPPKIYWIPSGHVKFAYSSAVKLPFRPFLARWEGVTASEFSKHMSKAKADETLEEYNCGEELTADFDVQTLTNPVNIYGKYDNEQRCRWPIKNANPFASLNIQIKKLDFEYSTSCNYDYLQIEKSVGMTSNNRYAEDATKYCHAIKDKPINITMFKDTTVAMITDRSRSATGFELDYWLGCTSYTFIDIVKSPYEGVLTSPGWPNGYRKNESCSWSIILGSRRAMNVTVELDLEGTDGQCTGDYIDITKSVYEVGKQRCGTKTFDFVAETGRIFVNFASDNSVYGKGFKLTMKEIINDCSSSHLTVDEHNSIKVLTPPGFPGLDNSLDCNYVITAPTGHRIKFTVDPMSFSMQNSDDNACTDDYLEIRDGPSEHAPLIGLYCRADPPSTIFSTGSSLFVRVTTDSMTPSHGFNATYELATCGGSVVLLPGQNSTITSPNYPMPYPFKSDCGWTIKAPLGHFVQANVERMNIKYSVNCTDEYVALRERNETGDYIMEPSCSAIGSRTPEGYQSTENVMYLEFKTNTTNRDSQHTSNALFCPQSICGFEVEVASTRYECGGDINDDEGTITLPGYPNPIIEIKCTWNFNAGIGNVYVLSFKFDDDADGFYYKRLSRRCFPSISFSDNIPRGYLIGGRMDYHFCLNLTNYVTESDLLRLTYTPYSKSIFDSFNINVNASMVNLPWSIEYKKIPGNQRDANCNRYITENLDWKFNVTDMDEAKSFCHLRIKRPFDGTTVVEFRNISRRLEALITTCEYGNHVQLKSMNESPWEIDETVCNVTGHQNVSTHYYPNKELDFLAFVRVIPFDDFDFDLSIRFYPCGGTIDPDEAQSGVITSPNFDSGNVYDKNMNCLWYLKAPEGQIIETEIDFMDIEYQVECKNDVLIVAEGQGLHSVIHRYCNSVEAPLPERFRKIRSHSRELTLLWHSDSNVQRKGFNLTYSFVSNNENGCGFTAHAGRGLITTPNYPKDYPSNANCIWDIIVPYGYHVKLEFEDFDVQLSRNCDKDFVILSQEYQSRALAPLGDYYFYFEHEDKQPTVCGNEVPKPFVAESNRIRLNFTTDASTSGRGFKAKWSTQCGSVMALTHGVITSPHYPLGYPNENLNCEYLIYPQLPNSAVPIITLKILDIDLAEYNIWGNEVIPADECRGDYLEIIDVNAHNKSLMKLCSHHLHNVTELPPISVHGGIGVRFAANKTRFESSKFKKSRGFKLSYALADCGGEIRLDGNSDRLTSVISSPGYPLPYHGNLDCVWNVTATEGRIIQAKFTAISIETSATDTNCPYDYVEMYNGIVRDFPTNYRGDTNDTRRIGRYCGASAPKDFIVTNGQNLTVRFRSDHSKSLGGFKLIVAATLGPMAGCGGDLIASSDWKTLTPPLDRQGKYFNSLRCLWTIKAEKKKLIEFRVNQLNVESRRRYGSNNTGCYDFIAIYDGPRATSSLLLPPTCSMADFPLTIQSSSRTANFYFESDTADSFDGFNVTYHSVDPDCGGWMTAIQDPRSVSYESDRGLTRTNLKNKRCRWFFFSKNKQPVVLEFKQFNFPSTDATCPFEFLEIRDIGIAENCEHPACNRVDRPRDVLRYCGTDKPARFVSQSTVVEITTSVLTTSQYSGKFALDYMILDNCNRTITIPDADSHFASGRITSPNYPNRYDDNSTCTTVLSGPADYRFLLVFKDFQIERGTGYRMRGSYGYGNHRGYGGFGGIRNSRWRDRGDMYEGLRYVSPNLGLYDGTSCTYDSVRITLDGSNPDEGNTTKRYYEFCGHRVPPTLLTEQSQMRIIMKSDDSMAGTGFDASYYMVRPAKLGDNVFYDFHTIYEKSGAIAPIGWPNNLSSNTIQRWKVAPPAGLECSFKVTELKLADEDGIGECNNTLRYAVQKADDKSATIPWQLLPCKESELSTMGEDGLIQKTKASVAYFELRTGEAKIPSYFRGFRIEWSCENYSEDVI
uniref:Cubilin n=1 Tax=Panagrellus redivivus TaxID=6233 RepID=A0A7E4UNF5_PANRE